jgi:hypothetical protein
MALGQLRRACGAGRRRPGGLRLLDGTERGLEWRRWEA